MKSSSRKIYIACLIIVGIALFASHSFAVTVSTDNDFGDDGGIFTPTTAPTNTNTDDLNPEINTDLEVKGLVDSYDDPVPNLPTNKPRTIVEIIIFFTNVVNAIIPIIIALAVIYFLWGIFKYVFANGEVDKKAAKGVMVYGIFALFVMVSVWGLVNLIGSLFDFEVGGTLETERKSTSELYINYFRLK